MTTAFAGTARNPLPPGLFDRTHRSFTLGAIAMVTLGALENRAVGSVLPTLVQELGGVASFGLVNAAPTASMMVGVAVAGLWADRHHPGPVLRAGVVALGLAQLLVGAASSIWVVVAGRLLSGVAEGLVDIALMVLVAQVLPESLRGRMFGLFAAMWVLPSVLGPFLSGSVAELVGWRWVFLGAPALLLPTWALLRRAVRQSTALDKRLGAEESVPARAVVGWALASALAMFVLNVAGGRFSDSPATGTAVAVVALAGLLVCGSRLLPSGTARAGRGLPSLVLLRGLVSGAFAGCGSFLPLLLMLVHGFGPARAGVTLSVTGVMWAVGSWLQGRMSHVSSTSLLRAGLVLMTAGMLGTVLLAVPEVPVWAGLVAWAVAGTGMGVTSPVVSVLTLELSTEHDRGRASSSVRNAGSIGVAVTFAIAGGLLAVDAPHPGPATFAAIVAISAFLALAALLLVGRVRPREAVAPVPFGD